MELTRKKLHGLVELIEENSLETLYNVMVRFIPEDEALPDELEAHYRAIKEFQNGEIFSEEDINWD